MTAIVTTVGGPWLGDQLAALAEQTRLPAQLVVVNNGPAGVVDAVVDEWRTRLPDLELVEDRSMAVCGHARNVGAARAQFPGLLFLDDDDVVSPGYVAAMSDALDRFEMVAARIDLERLNSAALVSRWGVMQRDEPMTYHDFLPWVIGGAFGIRRDTFTKLGGFDTAMRVGEDTDLCWRAQLDDGARIGFVPEATLSYRLRDAPGPAFRQSRLWGSWEPALYKRFAPRGLVTPRTRLRALLRWARPLLVLLRARRREDVVVAARLFGARVGRLEGSVRHRHVLL